MKNCQRTHTIDLGDGYSLFLLGEQSGLPTPQSRAFELPGDPLHYAPDRPADVQHVKLVITLDFEQETISGTVYTTFSSLFEEVKTIYFDAVELNIEEVTSDDGTNLTYSTSNKKLAVTLNRTYQHGEEFTIAVKYHARPRIGLHFMKPVAEDPTRPVHSWTFGQPRYHKLLVSLPRFSKRSCHYRDYRHGASPILNCLKRQFTSNYRQWPDKDASLAT